MSKGSEPAPAQPTAEPLGSAHDGRDETPAEQLDRHWSELLQELRVAQTGVQILVGFLLTLPFQQRFSSLDQVDRALYLTALVLATVATALIMAPVSMHRIVFRARLREELVTTSARLAQSGLAVLALALVAVVTLTFDVVLGAWGAVIGGIGALVVFAALWWVLPRWIRSHALAS